MVRATHRHSGGILNLCLLMPTIVVHTSWVPRPFDYYDSGLPDQGSAIGVQRFAHHELHSFEDGGDLELQWEADANPNSILSLDLEHQDGVMIAECRPNQLVLHVPGAHAIRVAQWQHVTASHHLHSCSHLAGSNLYHRVLGIQHIHSLEPPHRGSAVALATEELTSPSQIFSHCKVSFNLWPADVKEHHPDLNRPSRRLNMKWGSVKPQYTNSFTPETHEVNSLLNLNATNQLSNIAWNWDYDANATRNPQFKVNFPGGVGYMKLYQPYLKARIGISLNFTSHMKSVKETPHVNVVGALKGYADVNADITTAINFETDKSATVLSNIFEFGDIPGLPNMTFEKMFLKPIKFFMGGIPFTVQPRFSCKLKAYHIGLLKGSLRVGLATKLLFHGSMSFDTHEGLKTNFSAKAQNVKITPPNWMIFTRHFELGMMLEPDMWVEGGMGTMKDMSMGFGLRPYFNLSIMQENATALGGGASDFKQLAIYPFRALGLPAGKNYMIKIGANGLYKQTSNQKSTGGVAEYFNNVKDFDFGLVSENALINMPIEVSILENGQEPAVATGKAVCSSVVNGMCHPAPLTAQLKVDNQDVLVQLSTVWSSNAIGVLESKIKTISLRFPSVTVQPSISQHLSSKEAMASAHLLIKRNGRAYEVPLEANMNSKIMLKSRVIYELGPCFLGSWKYNSPHQGISTGAGNVLENLAPTVDLVINGVVMGTGTVPPVSWDQAMRVNTFHKLSQEIWNSLKAIPVMVPLYNPKNQAELVGTGQIEIDVLPAGSSSFWILPYQANGYQEGQMQMFYWTVHGGREGSEYDFNLSVMTVDSSGALTATDWEKTVHVGCTREGVHDLQRYTGGSTPCVFQYQGQLPAELVGQHLVMVASWEDAKDWVHKMLSLPFEFVSKRRLAASNWSPQSRNSMTSNALNHNVQVGLDSASSHCTAQPLKYAIGAGMTLVEHTKNIPTPMDMGSTGGGASNSGDWISKPASLFKLGDLHNSKRLSEILPKSLCAGGICEGMMPGCQKTQTNPLNIRQIVFKLSRTFKIDQLFKGPRIRDAVAYGLALLPSAIEVGSTQVKANLKQMAEINKDDTPEAIKAATTTNQALTTVPHTTANVNTNESATEASSGAFGMMEPLTTVAPLDARRLGIDADDKERHTEVEFDMFTVKIKEPIHYEINEEVIKTLLHRGAFKIEDGRERTHGPVYIKDFELHDAAVEQKALLTEFVMPTEELQSKMIMRRKLPMAVSVAAISTAFLFTFVATFALLRRRGYSAVSVVVPSMESHEIA